MSNTPISLIETVERVRQVALDRVELAKNRVLFEERLAGFLKAAQSKKDEFLRGYERAATPDVRGYKPQAETLSVAGGTKWIKIVCKREHEQHGSVFVFINAETGNVHKAATFKAPVTTNPRSNIFDDDFGASGITGHGAVYLR